MWWCGEICGEGFLRGKSSETKGNRSACCYCFDGELFRGSLHAAECAGRAGCGDAAQSFAGGRSGEVSDAKGAALEQSLSGGARARAVGLLSNSAANEEQILKPEEVLNALAQLPTSAWPYGRAVAILVDEKPSASEADKVAIRRTRGIVTGDLQGAQIAIHWEPTS